MWANLDVITPEQPFDEVVVLIVCTHKQHTKICAPQPRCALEKSCCRFLGPIVREVNDVTLDQGVSLDFEVANLDRDLW